MAILTDNAILTADELSVGGARPSADAWISAAKNCSSAGGNGMYGNGMYGNGMYLVHNGVVRCTSRSDFSSPVSGMNVSVDRSLLSAARLAALSEAGINCVRIWVNEGRLLVGDDIMLVLVAGDTRDHVIDTLVRLVKRIKLTCITESEF